MWLLARILPLSIGDLVPEDDERWSNFLRMLDIVDILFCPRITEDDAAYLASLISDYHEEFCYLYPSWSVIPKMHFMVHMPRLMIQWVVHICFVYSITASHHLGLDLLFVTGRWDSKQSMPILRAYVRPWETSSTFHTHWQWDTNNISVTWVPVTWS